MISKIAESLHMPRVAKIKNGTNKRLIVFKFISSNFAHLNPISTTPQSQNGLAVGDTLYSWRTRLYLDFKHGLMKHHLEPRTTDFHVSLKSFMTQDLFIFTFDMFDLASNNLTLFNWDTFKRTIGIGCHKNLSLFQNRINSNVSVESSSYNVRNKLACVYSSGVSKNLLHNISSCDKSVIGMVRFRQLVSEKGRLLRAGTSHCNVTKNDRNEYHVVSKRKIGGPLTRKGLLYSSLVFIIKRAPENATSVWGPFTVTSWVGILAAYTVTAIAFGIIKIVTMNNLDNSWYEFIISQFFSFINGERTFLQKEMTSIGDTSTGAGLVFDDKDNVTFDGSTYRCSEWRVDNGAFIGARRISVKSLSVPVENVDNSETSLTGNLRGSRQQNRGKISKVILYGTIRLISFILLAMYEGKLYNTITFPNGNAKLMESFEDLISSEKYIVKLTNEAKKYENITEKIRGNITTSSYVDSNVNAANKSRSGKLVESVNILDCVNWVESGDANHACVGYEFELRNLHKAQKSDKILIKSKQKLLRFGTGASTRFGRRRGFTMFPGGFQISKWILESGILQLWSVVENAFMESFINPNWNDPFKVFTIRDYLGLFVIYSLLLILASIMFILEHTIVIGRKVLRNSEVKDTWRSISTTRFGSKFKNILCCKEWKLSCVVFATKWRDRRYVHSSTV